MRDIGAARDVDLAKRAPVYGLGMVGDVAANMRNGMGDMYNNGMSKIKNFKAGEAFNDGLHAVKDADLTGKLKKGYSWGNRS